MSKAWMVFACSLGVTLVSSATVVSATADPTLPEGWVVAEQADEEKSDVPACCAFDTFCCRRQSAMDRAETRTQKSPTVDIDVAALPVGQWRATDDADVTVLDERGAPVSSCSGKQGRFRLVGNGAGGYVKLGQLGMAFFRDAEVQRHSHGIEHGRFNPHLGTDPELSWRSVDTDDDGRFNFRAGEGTYNVDSCKPKAMMSIEVELKNVYRGVVYGFRARRGDDEKLVFIIADGFSFQSFITDGAKAEGFSLFTGPFRYIELPLGAGKAGTVGVHVSSQNFAHWRLVGAQPSDGEMEAQLVFNVSQLSREPRATAFISIMQQKSEPAFFGCGC